MQGMKKGLQGAAVILLACAMLLAACGKSTNGDSKANAPAADSGTENQTVNAASDNAGEEPAEPELEPYVVQLMYPGSPQKDEQAVEAEMNKILQDKINATIDIQPIDWGAWGDKTNLIFASGDKADLIFTASWNGYGQNAAKGAYVELTDEMMQKFAPDVLAGINPLVTNAYKVNGKLYAVPTNKELAANAGLLIRKDIADKYGMDLSGVKSLKDMEPFFKLVKEKEPDMVPLYMNSGNYVAEYIADFDAMGDNNIPGGIQPVSGSTKVEEFINIPENLENIKTTRDFYLKGYINKDANTTKTGPYDALKANKAFAYVSGLKPGKDKEVEKDAKIPMTQIAFGPPVITSGSATSAALAISKTSENPERALMVANLLHTDKQLLNLLVFGIEGKHYTKVSDNIIEMTADSGNYSPGNNWMIGNQLLNYLTKEEDPQKWEQYAKFNESAKPSPALGFTFDSEAVKNEKTQLNNVRGQYIPAIMSGSVDPDKYIPQYLEKLKAAGIEKVMAEKQKQLDAFLAGK